MNYGNTIDQTGVAASARETADTMTMFDAGGADRDTTAVKPALGTSDFMLSSDGRDDAGSTSTSAARTAPRAGAKS
jgi:hypothetical protein